MTGEIRHATYRVHLDGAPSFDFSLDAGRVTTDEQALTLALDFLAEVKTGAAVYVDSSPSHCLVLTPETRIVRVDLLRTVG